MTYQEDFTLPTELLEQIAAQGFDFLPGLMRIMINSAMQLERQKYLSVRPYECSPERQAHANGSKPRTVKTRVGKVTFDMPQVREGGFYPEALEKGLRSERALTLALAEMYVQGVFRPLSKTGRSTLACGRCALKPKGTRNKEGSRIKR